MLFVVVVVTPPICWLASINCLKVTKRQHSTFCLGSGDDRLLPIRSTAYLCQSGIQKILQARKQIGHDNPVLDERTWSASDMERPVNMAELVAKRRESSRRFAGCAWTQMLIYLSASTSTNARKGRWPCLPLDKVSAVWNKLVRPKTIVQMEHKISSLHEDQVDSVWKEFATSCERLNRCWALCFALVLIK